MWCHWYSGADRAQYWSEQSSRACPSCSMCLKKNIFANLILWFRQLEHAFSIWSSEAIVWSEDRFSKLTRSAYLTALVRNPKDHSKFIKADSFNSVKWSYKTDCFVQSFERLKDTKCCVILNDVQKLSIQSCCASQFKSSVTGIPHEEQDERTLLVDYEMESEQGNLLKNKWSKIVCCYSLSNNIPCIDYLICWI